MPEEPEAPPTLEELWAAKFEGRRQNVLLALANTGQAEAVTAQVLAFLQGWFASHMAYLMADPTRITGSVAFVTALETAGITDSAIQAPFSAQLVRCYRDHFGEAVYQIQAATLDATPDPGASVRTPFESAYQDAMDALATMTDAYDIAGINIGSVVAQEIRDLEADPSSIAPLSSAYADWQVLQTAQSLGAQALLDTDLAMVAAIRADLQMLFAFPDSLIDGEGI